MADWEETRRSIVGAARGVFARFGPDKTTLEDVARASHKAKSSIYHYFRGKSELFWAVVAEERRLLREELARTVSSESTPLADLTAYALARVKALAEQASLTQVIRRESFEQDAPARRARGEYLDDQVSLVGAILRKWSASGALVVRDMEEAAKALVTALRVLDYDLETEGPAGRVEQAVGPMISLFLGGMTAKQP